MEASSGRMLVQQRSLPWHEGTGGLHPRSSNIMTIRTMGTAVEEEEEDTRQSMETDNIKMPATKAVPARREEAALGKKAAAEALIWVVQRDSEGPITLREAAWVLLGIGAGRTCHEEVDRRVLLQVSLVLPAVRMLSKCIPKCPACCPTQTLL